MAKVRIVFVQPNKKRRYIEVLICLSDSAYTKCVVGKTKGARDEIDNR